jgi:hypothetical protein
MNDEWGAIVNVKRRNIFTHLFKDVQNILFKDVKKNILATRLQVGVIV